MFATLLGGLPRPDDTSDSDLIAAVVRAQAQAGLEPITDGRLGRGATLFEARTWAAGGLHATGATDAATLAVAAWSATAALTERAVKQALPGPYTVGRSIGSDDIRQGEAATLEAADRLGRA